MYKTSECDTDSVIFLTTMCSSSVNLVYAISDDDVNLFLCGIMIE